MSSSSTSLILEARKPDLIRFVKQDYGLLIDLLTEADLRHNVTHNVASAFLNELQSFERTNVSEEKRIDGSSSLASIDSPLESARRFVEIKKSSMNEASLQQKSLEELRALYLEIQNNISQLA